MAFEETLRESFLSFLLMTNQLDNIKEICYHYTKNSEKQVAYRFHIFINIFDLYEHDGILGNFCLHKPLDAQKVLQLVLFNVISTNKWIVSLEDINQIHPVLKIDQLPPFPEYKIHDISKFQIHQVQRRFYQLEGIVISQTTVTKYTQSTRFFCKSNDCPGNKGQKYICFHILGTNETQTVRNDYLCTYCGKCLTEDPTYRVLGEKIIIKIVSPTAITQSNTRHRSIDVYARDELVNSIQLGKQYSIIGLPMFELLGNVVNFSLEANNIFEILDVNFYDKILSMPAILDTSDLKRPWNIPLTLSFYFGAHIIPPGSFIRLKLFVLLCLVCSPDTESSWVMSLLVVGFNTLLIHRLLYYGSQFSQRAIYHNSINPIKVAVVKESTSYQLHAGSLLLAWGGVCYLGTLSKLSKSTQEILKQVLECAKITVDIPCKKGDSVFWQISYPLMCQVWAYTDTSSKKDHSSDIFSMKDTDEDLPKPLSEIFGLVCFTDSNDSSDEELLTSFSLTSAMGIPSFQNVISESFIKQHIQNAYWKKLKFSSDAEHLIRGYFIASRRINSVKSSRKEFPLFAIKTLFSLAEAHAKLSLQSEVTKEDALFSVLLYEETISVRYGRSMLGVKPLYHLKHQSLELYLSNEFQKLIQFEKVLKNFIYSYASDVTRSEE